MEMKHRDHRLPSARVFLSLFLSSMVGGEAWTNYQQSGIWFPPPHYQPTNLYAHPSSHIYNGRRCQNILPRTTRAIVIYSCDTVLLSQPLAEKYFNPRSDMDSKCVVAASIILAGVLRCADKFLMNWRRRRTGGKLPMRGLF